MKRPPYIGTRNLGDSVSLPFWVEDTFQKCECMQFIQDPRDTNRCGCGRDKSLHDPVFNPIVGTWTWNKHAIAFPTDSYGIVELPTGVHAHYLRMSPNAKAGDVVRLLTEHWGAEPPKLIISIHGGTRNFDLPAKRAFRRSLQRMAAVQGCWIITSGLNSGAAKHVGDALTAGVLRRNQAVVIGIAGWGIVAGRQRLAVANGNVHYYPPPTAPGVNVLNPNHSFFLLVDDGSVGKFGNEVKWRQEFEAEISSQDATPLVALFVEGGVGCFRIALDYLSAGKPIVVAGESGRASDILSMAMQLVDSNSCSPSVNEDSSASPSSHIAVNAIDENDLAFLDLAIQQAFGTSSSFRKEAILNEVVACIKYRKLVTIWSPPQTVAFSQSSSQSSIALPEELDICILSTLLKAKKRSAPDQLRLALAWNRVDLAKCQIFTENQLWPDGALNDAMIEALIMDRVEFVKVLLDHGVIMADLLTCHRLEQLYNIRHADAWIIRDATRQLANRQTEGRLALDEIGTTIDALMGFGYQSNYNGRTRLQSGRNKVLRLSNLFHLVRTFQANKLPPTIPSDNANRFTYPFSELLIWAVLMQRHSMAKLMCSKGEEMLAKTLIACRLYRSMAAFVESDTSSETVNQLKDYAKDFANLAIDLLEKCHKLDEVMTQQLLTYELRNFSKKTCLSLAVSSYNKRLVAHPCCQNLLDVLWMGGLRVRSTRPWKILLGLVFPPFAIFGLNYLSQEELNLQPQTEAELEEKEDGFNKPDDASENGDAASPTVEDPQQQGHRRYSISGLTDTHRGVWPRSRSNSVAEPPDRSGRYSDYALAYLGSENPFKTIHTQFSATPSSLSLNRSRLSIMTDNSGIIKFGTQLDVATRIREFYNAPVTKFWLDNVGYTVFILCFCYTILTESSLYQAQWPEMYMTAYVITLFFDKCREIASIDAHGFKARLEIHFVNSWNIFDALAIFLFIIGLPLRWVPQSFEVGRAFFIVSLTFFLIHTFDIFQANQGLATYIMILSYMMKSMISFLIILGVAVAMYGIVLNATRYPYRRPDWDILKDIWIEPFFNLYGEAYHEFVDTNECDSEFKNTTSREKPPCWCCTWIGPVAQAVFLIIANILMINLLVAVFNSVFEKVDRISKDLIRFQRYRLIVDYQLLPILPPPFIVIPHFYLMIRALVRWCKGRQFGTRDPGLLKVVLSDPDVASLHDFEEQARDELIEQRETVSAKSILEEQMRVTAERVEAIQTVIEEVLHSQRATMTLMHELESRLTKTTSNEATRGHERLSERISFCSASPTKSSTLIRSEEGDELPQSAVPSILNRRFRRLKAVSECQSVAEGEAMQDLPVVVTSESEGNETSPPSIRYTQRRNTVY